MSDIEFDRLTDLPLRDAWAHEALEFTPWLAENIDHLSGAIRVPLEVVGTEVAVESFSADILARNPMDDTKVLIENQLETTDHSHLGQIMTYLAGLGAKTVVWVAPAFREPHLSAIRWLNEHTSDGFSFFAVRARVVRIGNSPFAPVFDVIEKPNDWDRQVNAMRRSAERSGSSDLGDLRGAYWASYVSRNNGTVVPESRGGYVTFSSYHPSIVVVLWIGQKEGGIFMRGRRGTDAGEFFETTAPLVPELERLLEVEDRVGDGTRFGQRMAASLRDEGTWPEIHEWQEHELRRYLAALESISKSEA